MSTSARSLSGIRNDCTNSATCRRLKCRKREVRRKFKLAGLVCAVVIVGVVTRRSSVGAADKLPAPDEGYIGGGRRKGRAEGDVHGVKGRSNSGQAKDEEAADDESSGIFARQLADEADDNAAEACTKNIFAGGGVGHVVLLVIAILFTFNGLAIVCDEFFQGSLEKISEVLGLTPDVAGATFLAAGSSAPELFTSIADVFGPSNSIGVGTIVGSAMFNVLVIVALSAAVAANAGSSAKIDHRVVARDVTFYTASIFMLVASASDGKIYWWEALMMVLSYGLYIIFMIYNARILQMCSAPKGTVIPTAEGMVEAGAAGLGGDAEDPLKKPDNAAAPAVGDEGDAAGGGPARRRSSAAAESADGLQRRTSAPLGRRASRALRVSMREGRRSSQAGGEEDDPMTAAAIAATAAMAAVTISKEGAVEVLPDPAKEAPPGDEVTPSTSKAPEFAASTDSPQLEDDANSCDLLKWPEGWVERFLFVFGFPFMVALSLTVPDCSRPKYEKYYILTFVMSISWISAISSFMVSLATGAACILGVSAIVMGVLVLAVGTSVPDMIGSMIAARNGEASMAIANAIGSNVFNILLGLGGPWLVSSLFSGEPTAVGSEGATTALIILFCAVLIFVGSLILSRWSMTKTLAYSLIATYGIYVVYTITAEALK